MPANSDLDPMERIAAALERAYPPTPDSVAVLNDRTVTAYGWTVRPNHLRPINHVARLPLALLRGIDLQIDLLMDNTRRFAKGLPANNALLWGARGMGKSSLIKAAHAEACRDVSDAPPALIEIHREDIETLPDLLALLRETDRRCLLFCDDLSFDAADTSYKSLKAVLEGGIEGRPENVLFYATSNRRHLMSRDAIENEQATALMPGEAVEEKVSLSDRFGLWIGFHPCNQEVYFSMVA
ncbi:MAG: ATP-binding protein, partial [Pseudomonadota bacterium]